MEWQDWVDLASLVMSVLAVVLSLRARALLRAGSQQSGRWSL